jgi:hypothetical protein
MFNLFNTGVAEIPWTNAAELQILAQVFPEGIHDIRLFHFQIIESRPFSNVLTPSFVDHRYERGKSNNGLMQVYLTEAPHI